MSRTPSRRALRWMSAWLRGAACASLVAGLLAAGGCKSGDATPGAGGRSEQRESVKPGGELALPTGLETRAVKPLTGEALERAKKPLAEVVASVPRPDYLPAAGAAPVPTEPRPEPPLAAQRAYLAGRMTWREGKSYEAIRQLQQAVRLAPNEPDILRLLGDIYTSIGNKVRGAQYIREAVQADPTDVEGIVLLGRFALEEGRWSEAIAALSEASARQPAGGDPVLRRLLRYYLAGALMQEGYAQAAIEEYGRYLEGLGNIGTHATPHARELAIIDQQSALTWQSVGDLRHQLGDAKGALAAYERAAAADEAGRPGLVRRLLYTHLLMGDEDSAQALVLDRLGRSDADASTLQLVRYVTEHGGDAEAFAKNLRELYERDERSPTMALAIADLLPPAQAAELLTEHLEHRPQDRPVFDRLLSRHLLPSGAGSASPEAVERAVNVTADLMDRSPRTAEELALALTNQAQDSASLLAAMKPIPVAQRPSVDVIRALAHIGAGEVDQAQAVLEQVLAAAPGARAARLQLGRLLIARDQYDDAAAVLEPLSESKDPDAIALRVRVLSETGKSDEALALLDEMIGTGAADVPLVLQKATLQLRGGDAVAAERTLLDALNVHPQDERVYEAILNLYDPSSPGQAQVPDSTNQWKRLVRRLLSTIPQSRIGRLVRAEIHDAKGEFNDAEALLKGLLEENEHDTRALRDILELYVRANRKPEALALLEAHVAASPKDPQTLLVAGAFYKQLGEFEKTMDVVERWLVLRGPTPARDLQLALLCLDKGEYAKAEAAAERALTSGKLEDPTRALSLLGRALLKQQRGDEADKRFVQAIQKHPELAAELGYERAALWHEVNDRARTERLMLENLERFPDHPGSNNDVGYNWVVQNKNLAEARAMIQKAVDADPESAAYLDSLGWAYYKLGRFAEAETWLRRSRQASRGNDNPVIVDHLGDALYRQGKRQEAVRAWEEAKGLLETALPMRMEQYGARAYQQGLVAEAVHLWKQVNEARNGQQPWGDPEMVGLSDRLTAKIEGGRGDGGVPVALLPGEPDAPVALPGDPADEAEGAGEEPQAGMPAALERLAPAGAENAP